jgi:hypothetical protein
METKMSKNVTTLAVTEKQLAAAINVIARFFHEEKHDVKTGEVKNALGYTQKAVLNGMIWKIDQLIARTQDETLPKAMDAARRAGRSYRGDELSEQQLNQRLDWIDTLKEQVSIMNMYRAAALKAYTEHTGEDYYRGTATAPVVPASAGGALGRLASMGLAQPERNDRNSPAIGEAGREERSA